MNVEQAKRAIEVMQAYVDGKPIEYKSKIGISWLAGHPDFNWYACDYRIATEPPKPTFRPFASAEEFRPHRDRWIFRDDKGASGYSGSFRISSYDNSGVWISQSHVPYSEMLSHSFEDGTPCGVEVQS